MCTHYIFQELGLNGIFIQYAQSHSHPNTHVPLFIQWTAGYEAENVHSWVFDQLTSKHIFRIYNLIELELAAHTMNWSRWFSFQMYTNNFKPQDRSIAGQQCCEFLLILSFAEQNGEKRYEMPKIHPFAVREARWYWNKLAGTRTKLQRNTKCETNRDAEQSAEYWACHFVAATTPSAMGYNFVERCEKQKQISI